MKIALTYTGSDVKHANYARWLEGKAGGREASGGQTSGGEADGREAGEGKTAGEEEGIEVIEFSTRKDNFDELRDCDGLVLSGGVDIDPSFYGGDAAYVKAPAKGWEKDRDVFEQSLLRFALEEGIPVFGVCRGLQLINVTLQGTLVQDLGEAGDGVHENVVGVDKKHGVRVEKGSLLEAIADTETGEVNSAHHQAIGRLGEGLIVNCRADDGTIEGIEWADPAGKPFMIAVQWHPERMIDMDNALTRKLRERFLEETETRRQREAGRNNKPSIDET